MTQESERTKMKKLKIFAAAFLTGTMLLCSTGAAMASNAPMTPTGSAMTSEAASIVPADAVSSTAGTAAAADTKASALANTMTSQLTDQIILVVDHTLSLYNKQAGGSWTQAMETYCGYGRNGLKAWNLRQEGDQTTPIGSFPILFAFGVNANPGTAMTWRDVTPYSYWSGEKDTYNTWVESTTPISGEHLSDYTICYKYAMAIGFNQNPTVYKRGSAIFLHCKNPAEWGSAGCVSVVDEDMIRLLALCHDGCYIMIVPDEASIANY